MKRRLKLGLITRERCAIYKKLLPQRSFGANKFRAIFIALGDAERLSSEASKKKKKERNNVHIKDRDGGNSALSCPKSNV